MAETDIQGAEGGRPLRAGMLLWEPPKPMLGKPEVMMPGSVWCVKSVAKKSARLIYADDSLQAEATLKGNTIPPGWREIRNRPLWKFLESQAEAA